MPDKMFGNVFSDRPGIDVERLARGACPDCGGADWIAGPRGGAAQNFFCANAPCGAGFNMTVLHGAIWLHGRIGTWLEFVGRMGGVVVVERIKLLEKFGASITLCSRDQRRSFAIEEDGRAIRFLPCGVKSWNANDVRHHFCARCGYFIDTMEKA